MNFLAQVNTLPEAPWKIPVLTICLFGCCVLLMNMENIQGRGLVLKVCLELGIAVWISSFLGFSYTGMILLILADKVYSEDKRTDSICGYHRSVLSVDRL